MKEANLSTAREFWKALILEQSASGLTQGEFCKSKGVALGTFTHWRSTLKKESLKKEKSSNMVRIEVAKRCEPMRIVLNNGVALHFAETPSPEWLTLLMKLVS